MALLPKETSYVLDAGQNLPDITCTADCGTNSCTYKWKHNTREFSNGPMLLLKNVQKSETGIYECNAQDDTGSTSVIAIYVKVLYGPEEIILNPRNTSYTKSENDFIPLITCSAVCDPPCVFTWTMPGGGVSFTSPTLRLDVLDRREQGVYKCTAHNRISSGYVELTVIVNYGPGRSIQLQPNKTFYEVMENSTINDVICSADCRPGCKITWNATCMTNVLSLKQIKRDQAGVYMCTASNVAGTSMSLFEIKVKYPSVIKSLNIINKTDYLMEGDEATLICEIDSYPAPNVLWVYRENGTTLLKDSHERSRLLLQRVRCFDMGTYSCAVYNGIGASQSRDIKVKGYCKPRLDERKNQKTMNLLSLGTEEGISLTVDIISHPPPNITWYFTGIDSDDLINVLALERFVMDSEVNGCLVKTYLRKDIIGGNEFGTYVLQVENAFGSVNISFVVVPHGPPDPPYQLNAVCPTSTRAVLSWKPGFNRGDEQIFYIQYRSLNEKFRRFQQIIEDVGKDNISEYLTKLQKNMLYQFTVVAVNKFGITLSKEIVNCTTKDTDNFVSPQHSSAGSVVAGALIGSVVLILIILIAVLVYRKRLLLQEIQQ
ncbi:hypothetical protein KUTeg_004639 [Tegillarca granosa]|uniref:Uncharacterized protein n=1 Tax=Tegillarca granosa TaxID=220873 RepID=A0ABQ9FMD9_TEGGR|nr:hypothetical protein KUTeg_004639 [Tegillarca granosa]